MHGRRDNNIRVKQKKKIILWRKSRAGPCRNRGFWPCSCRAIQCATIKNTFFFSFCLALTWVATAAAEGWAVRISLYSSAIKRKPFQCFFPLIGACNRCVTCADALAILPQVSAAPFALAVQQIHCCLAPAKLKIEEISERREYCKREYEYNYCLESQRHSLGHAVFFVAA